MQVWLLVEKITKIETLSGKCRELFPSMEDAGCGPGP
jgi:hypothetical protein